jgi:N-acetylmuramoyl-L-alanine amidase
VSELGQTFARGRRVAALGAGCFTPRNQNTGSAGAWTAGLLAVLLAGCATGPREGEPLALDEQREDVTTAAAVPLAPPALPAPEPAPAPPAPTVATNQPAETWVPLSRWCRANGLAAPCPVTLAGLPAHALSTPNGVFVFRPGSESARWDGLDLRLGFAPQMMGGQPCVHALDLKKTLEPLATRAPASCLKTNPTIVIDPGHGGGDSGAKSVLGYGYEKDFTLDWARRLGALLASNGWQVFLTRNTDTDLSLSNRVAIAEARQADLFLSLHFNSAAPDERGAGLETYCLTPTGLPSSVTRGYGDDLALAFPNNAFDAQNLQLALRVHRELLQVNGRLDRGVRRARYLGVLRGQNRPAVLVEGGYLSNPREARLIAAPVYRQKLAEALALALAGKSEVQSLKSKVESRESEATGRRAEAVVPKPLSP